MPYPSHLYRDCRCYIVGTLLRRSGLPSVDRRPLSRSLRPSSTWTSSFISGPVHPQTRRTILGIFIGFQKLSRPPLRHYTSLYTKLFWIDRYFTSHPTPITPSSQSSDADSLSDKMFFSLEDDGERKGPQKYGRCT